MIKDIEIIEKELIDHVELEFPYENIKLNINLKYITHKNDSEYFFKGGKLIHICNDYLTLQNKGPKWNVPINVRDKKGNIIYKSRFFVNENEFNQNDNNNNNNDNNDNNDNNEDSSESPESNLTTSMLSITNDLNSSTLSLNDEENELLNNYNYSNNDEENIEITINKFIELINTNSDLIILIKNTKKNINILPELMKTIKLHNHRLSLNIMDNPSLCFEKVFETIFTNSTTIEDYQIEINKIKEICPNYEDEYIFEILKSCNYDLDDTLEYLFN